MGETVPAPDARTAGRRALWLLLLMVAFTALLLGVDLLFPGLQPSGIPTAVRRLLIHAAILLGLWLGLSRTDFPLRVQLGIWLAVVVPFTAWLAIVWPLAINGAFQTRLAGGVTMVPIAIFAPVAIAVPVLMLSRRIGSVLDATPASWLVGIQLYRVVGVLFLVAWARGGMAGVFAVPAGSGDVLVGLMALPVAYYLASGARGGRGLAIAWNVLGLVDFAIAISIGMLSALRVIITDLPTAGSAPYPTVMIPVFGVPSSIILHALSLRQLSRIGRREAAARLAPLPAAPSSLSPT